MKAKQLSVADKESKEVKPCAAKRKKDSTQDIQPGCMHFLSVLHRDSKLMSECNCSVCEKRRWAKQMFVAFSKGFTETSFTHGLGRIDVDHDRLREAASQFEEELSNVDDEQEMLKM